MLCVSRPERLDAARAAVQEILHALDHACNRFRPDSDVQRVNRAAGQVVRVGPVFADALGRALDAARQTGGAVDPTAGTCLLALGYDRSFSRGLSSPAEVRPVPAPGWELVHLDAIAGLVRVPAGVTLDLGATAKALAVDLGVMAAHRATGGGALLSIGGDVAVEGAPPRGGWIVRVTHDHAATASEPGATVCVMDGALATSSTTVRRWRRGLAELHHLIDPATGSPAAGPWRAASVAAASCVGANTASTAALVRGESAVERLEEWALPARLERHDGEAVRVGAWPSTDRSEELLPCGT